MEPILLTVAQVNEKGEVERHRFSVPPLNHPLGKILRDLDPALLQYASKVTTATYSGPPNDQVWSYVPKPGETVLVWCQPKHVSLMTVLLIASAVISVGTTIYSLVTRPKTPKTSSASPGMDLWEGITSYAEPGTPIPVVYGEVRTGGQIIAAHTEIHDRHEYLYMLICLGHGPVAGILAESALGKRRAEYNYDDGSIHVWSGEWDEVEPSTTNDPPAVWIDGRLASSYSDVYVYFRPGTQDQSVVPGFEAVRTTYSVDQEITAFTSQASAAGADYTKDFLNRHPPTSEATCRWLFSGAEYESSEEVDELDLELTARQGFVNVHKKKGYKTQHAWVRITWCSFRPEDPSHHLESGSFVRHLAGRYSGPYSWTFKIRLRQRAKVHVEIRLTGLAHWEDWDQYRLWLSSVTEVVNETRTYPGYALLGLKIRASGQLSGSIPNVTCLLRGKSDIRYWDGSRWRTGWTRNPIWCVRDLLTNQTYGLGNWIGEDQLGGWVEQTWKDEAAYCDELVTVTDQQGTYQEPRFSLDLVINNRLRAQDALEVLLKSCRGSIVRSGSKWRPVIDRPRSRTQIFTNANVRKGSLRIQNHGLRERFNQVDVRYQDKDNRYEAMTYSWATSAVRNGEELPRPTEVTLPGVVRWSQAEREAKYWLNRMAVLRRSASFEAAVDAIACEPGDRIGIQSEVFLPPPTGATGRVQSSDGTTVYLDKPVELEEGRSYRILIRDSDTDQLAEADVSDWGTDANGNTYVVLGEAPSFSPAFPDVYVLGEVGHVVKDFVVTSIERTGEQLCRIEAVEYNEQAFDGTDEASDQPFAAPGTEELYEVGSIANLKVSYEPIESSPGAAAVNVHVSWKVTGSQAAYGGASLQWKELGSDDWVVLAYVSDAYEWVWENAPAGIQGTIRVIPYSKAGRANPTGAAEVNVSTSSPELPPPMVTGVSYRVLLDGSFFVYWPDLDDPYLAGYEVRLQDSGWGSTGYVYRGRAPRFSYQAAEDTVTFYIRAFNSAWQYSSRSYVLTCERPPLVASTFLNVKQDIAGIILAWDVPQAQRYAYTEVWRAENVNNRSQATIVATLRDTTYLDRDVSYGTTYYYWVRHVDTTGQTSEYFPVSATGGVGASPRQVTTSDLSDEAVAKEKLQQYIRDRMDEAYERAHHQETGNVLVDPTFEKAKEAENVLQFWGTSTPDYSYLVSDGGYGGSAAWKMAARGDYVDLTPRVGKETYEDIWIPLRKGDRIYVKARVWLSSDLNGTFGAHISVYDASGNFIATRGATWSADDLPKGTWTVVQTSFEITDDDAYRGRPIFYLWGSATQGYLLWDDIWYGKASPPELAWAHPSDFFALNGQVIYAETIGTEQLAAESVTAGKIAAEAVTTDKIAVGAVDADRVADGAIVTEKLAVVSVTSEKLADGAVTEPKIESSVQNRINTAYANAWWNDPSNVALDPTFDKEKQEPGKYWYTGIPSRSYLVQDGGFGGGPAWKTEGDPNYSYIGAGARNGAGSDWRYFPVRVGDRIYTRARVWISSDFNGTFRMKLAVYKQDRSTTLGYPGPHLDPADFDRETWVDIETTISIDYADAYWARPYFEIAGATTGYVLWDNVYWSKTPPPVLNWAHSSDTTLIDGGKIYTGTVTANALNVNQLSAITANMGTLTAGLIQAVSGNAKIKIDANNKRIDVYDENGTLRVRLGYLG